MLHHMILSTLVSAVCAFSAGDPIQRVPWARRDTPPGCGTFSNDSTTCAVEVEGAVTTIEIETNGDSAMTETFTATSLSEFASITSPTTVTATDNAGETVVAAVFAAGLEWLAVPKAGAPPVEPLDAPSITQEPAATQQDSSTAG